MQPRFAILLTCAALLAALLPAAGQDDKKDDEVTRVSATGEFPKAIKKHVVITDRTLEYAQCNAIRNAADVRSLRFTRVFLKLSEAEDSVQRLAGIQTLESLELYDSSGDFLRYLDEVDREKLFPKLTKLQVRSPNLNYGGQQIASDWIAWRFLGKMPALEELVITGAAFGGKAFKGKKLTALKTLDLNDTNLTDGDLPALAAAAPALETLKLERTRLNGKGLKSLASIKGLKRLDLVSAALDETHLAGLKDAKALEELVLHKKETVHQESITEAGAAHLAAIPGLKRVSIRVSDPAVLRVLKEKAPKLIVTEIKD